MDSGALEKHRNTIARSIADAILSVLSKSRRPIKTLWWAKIVLRLYQSYAKPIFVGLKSKLESIFSRFITHVVMQKMSHIFPIFRLLGNALFYIKIPFCFCSLSLKKVKARTKQFWRGSLVDHFCTSLLKRYVLPSAMYWIFRRKGRFFTRNNLWS